ncbi:MAG: restriction endonuclease [Planctomycetaceae bacterium]|jgi:restriction system protein|nr:restriction endonuclease [Planctomycetaceae bacterium]
MPVPEFQECFLPFLKIIGDNKLHKASDIKETLAEHFQLTEAEKNERLKSGGKRFGNNVDWVRSYFKRVSVIETPEKGYVKITKRGLDILKEKPDSIDIKYLKRFSEYIVSGKKNENENAAIDGDEKAAAPEEVIDENYEILRQALADELLSQIHAKKSDFFERLVVKLLVRMGYGGSMEDAGKAVGQSGDGGIDGIIKEDKLGLDVVYLQAKRWKDSSIGRPEIQKFVGALAGHGAKKGVFITTSTFTEDARKYQPHNDTKIVLIDGTELMQLMIDYNLGVTTVASYEIKRMDYDFFEEE